MALNKTLLRKIRNKILRVPESYEQGVWGEPARTPCGTQACIAGHALIESGVCTAGQLNDLTKVNPKTGKKEFLHVRSEARKVLGLSLNQTSVLFHSDGSGWKAPYEERFQEADSPKERARVAADYINWIIKTGRVR